MGDGTLKDYVLIGLLSSMIFGVASAGLFRYVGRPVSVREEDANEDNRPDIVIRYGEGKKKRVFIQQEDGTYTLLEEVVEQEKESIYKRLDSIENKL